MTAPLTEPPAVTTPSAVDEALDRTAVGQVVELTMENLGQALRDTAILAAEVRRLRQPVTPSQPQVADDAVLELERRYNAAQCSPDYEVECATVFLDAIALLRRRTAGALEKEKHEDGLDSVRRMDADALRGEVGLQLLVDRFLRCPLPASVRSDDCACIQGYPHRTGTNLLTKIEAKEVLRFVLDLPAPPAAGEKT